MGTIAQFRGVDPKSTATNYFASLVNAVASMVLALLVPMVLTWYRDMAAAHAVGLTAVAGGLLESAFSLRFGVLFLVFFSAFYLARQSSKPALRVCLFWIPASLLTALGFAVWMWIASVMRLAARS